MKTENDGNDLIITFDGKGNGITEKEFAPKLMADIKTERCFTDMRVCRMLIMWNRFFLHVPLYSLNQKGWNRILKYRTSDKLAGKM